MKDGTHGSCAAQGWSCPNQRKKQTNADRIRSMSDEELAEFFENEITMPDDGLYLIIEGKQIWNKYDMLAWLQSEVEE